MRFIIKLFDCIVLSVLWAVFSLPIITMGAATTALYYTVFHYLREEEGYLWKYFWNSFKENFKRSTLASLALLAMLAFLIYDAVALRLLIMAGHPLGRHHGVILVLIVVAIVWGIYLAAYCARFNGTVREVLRISFYLMMAHPLRSLGIMAIVFMCGVLIATIPGLAAFLPALSCWGASYWIEQIFELHLKQDEEKREEES